MTTWTKKAQSWLKKGLCGLAWFLYVGKLEFWRISTSTNMMPVVHFGDLPRRDAHP